MDLLDSIKMRAAWAPWTRRDIRGTYRVAMRRTVTGVDAARVFI
jgi:hypothetical protein